MVAQQVKGRTETTNGSAQKVCLEHKRKFKECLADIAAHRLETQKQRERDKQAAEQRILQEKERITTEIVDHGLWLTIADVIDDGLSSLKSETKKREALKAQIRFRKTVLQQSSEDKDIFTFSKNGRDQFNSVELRDNLIKLLEAAQAPSISQSKAHGHHTDEEDLSYLVGKHIKHNFSEDGQLVTYRGRVIPQVPGFPNWFNVTYTHEPDVVYTYNLRPQQFNFLFLIQGEFKNQCGVIYKHKSKNTDPPTDLLH